MKSLMKSMSGKRFLFIAAGLLIGGLLVVSCGGGGGGSYGGGTGASTAAPGAFSLVDPSPADGAPGIGTTPTFAWTISPSAATYRVQVDTTGAFTGPFVINDTVGSTIYSYAVPAGTLSAGTLYYWRVVAQNAYGQAIAGPRSFTP